MTEEEARQLKIELAKEQEEGRRKDRRIAELERELSQALSRLAQLEKQSPPEASGRIGELEEQLEKALVRMTELEKRQSKDSHNSSKPPSSDGLNRRRYPPRKKSQKPIGGQRGHEGHTLMQVAQVDQIIGHRPSSCPHCGAELSEVVGSVKEHRQVHDLPQLRLVVQDHQVEEVCCPHCQHSSRGSFPEGVEAPVQYGPRVQGLAVYLSQFHLLPMERTCEVLEDLCGSSICQGTLGNWIQAASQRLAPTMERMKALLTIGRLQHTDETGMRLGGLLHWMHVNSTRWLTHYAWHRKRGQKAMDDIGILPQFQGYAMHDRLSSYDQYDCAHLLCGAHLLRDCLYVVEREKQPWAQDMHDLLLDMVKAANQWRERGAQAIPKPERDEWVAQYFAILVTGFAAHSPADTAPAPQTKGRQKQSDSKNLLNAFSKRAEQILAFLDDLSLPFSNNQAERDLRMIKVQQKISGTFRSEAGATAFCTIRSYLSTMRKQGRDLLDALAAVFTGSPFPIAWEPR